MFHNVSRGKHSTFSYLKQGRPLSKYFKSSATQPKVEDVDSKVREKREKERKERKKRKEEEEEKEKKKKRNFLNVNLFFVIV